MMPALRAGKKPRPPFQLQEWWNVRRITAVAPPAWLHSNIHLSQKASMKTPPLSRRQWLGTGLAACGYLAATQGHLLADDAPAPGLTKPASVSKRGLAPGLQHRLIHTGASGEKSYALIFAVGDEVLSGVTEFAENEGIQSGHLSAIGGFRHGLFGWFDEQQKAFRNIRVDQQVEVCSLLGDIGLADGKPQVHIHGVVAFSSGETRGGHLLEAYVGPTLELFLTTWPEKLIKIHHEETDLTLFDLHTHA
jgi:predicted DNA-binding protein with PD1-like motif